MANDKAISFPGDNADETELLLSWLDYLRGAVTRKLDGVSESDARWRPEGRLTSLLGVVNHLTHVEWRWIDGGILGKKVSRSEDEFFPGPSCRSRRRSPPTVSVPRPPTPSSRKYSLDTPNRRQEGTTLRWVLLHLINETARHAGHADAVRRTPGRHDGGVSRSTICRAE